MDEISLQDQMISYYRYKKDLDEKMVKETGKNFEKALIKMNEL